MPFEHRPDIVTSAYSEFGSKANGEYVISLLQLTQFLSQDVLYIGIAAFETPCDG